MMRHAYLFEARSIQQYILASGRLAEMVGASKIIDALTAETLDAVLVSLNLREINCDSPLEPGGIAFSRREGGVFVAFLADHDEAIRLRALWTLVVQSVAPGLEWIDALTSGETFFKAVDTGYKALATRRNQPDPSLPEATPYMRIAPRTGEPATRRGKKSDWRDAPGVLKHEASKRDTLLRRKFLHETRIADVNRYVFPRELTPDNESSEHAFPFKGSDRNVAIVHADGNGLGLILNVLKKALNANDAIDSRYLTIYRGFSDAISQATRDAARHATETVLLPAARSTDNAKIVPARPLVLAGDDLNIIVRADLALEFTKVFLETFECESAKALTAWKEYTLRGLPVSGLPDRLTACAGVVFCSASQPFASAYALSEALCKAAKQQAGQHKIGDLKPGGFIFHRVTTSFIDDWNDIVAETLTVTAGQQVARLSLGCYGAGITAAQSRLPSWTKLEQLTNELACETLSRGGMRELAMLMHQSPELMRQRYARWRENVSKSGPRGKRKLSRIDELLADLGVQSPSTSPFTDDSKHPATPIGDVVSLLSFNRTKSSKADATRAQEARA